MGPKEHSLLITQTFPFIFKIYTNIMADLSIKYSFHNYRNIVRLHANIYRLHVNSLDITLLIKVF